MRDYIPPDGKPFLAGESLIFNGTDVLYGMNPIVKFIGFNDQGNAEVWALNTLTSEEDVIFDRLVESKGFQVSVLPPPATLLYLHMHIPPDGIPFSHGEVLILDNSDELYGKKPEVNFIGLHYDRAKVVTVDTLTGRAETILVPPGSLRRINPPVDRGKFPHDCPECGSPCYQGLNLVDCTTKTCRHFQMSVR